MSIYFLYFPYAFISFLAILQTIDKSLYEAAEMDGANAWQRFRMNFTSYLDQVRIDASMELLRDGSLKVYEISEKVGYSNVDYFHTKFKKIVGESPAEYRRKFRN